MYYLVSMATSVATEIKSLCYHYLVCKMYILKYKGIATTESHTKVFAK